MSRIDKKRLSERDICTKFITPALTRARWDLMNQIREEVSFTKGRVIVRGRLSTRGEPKRADYLLYFKPGIPLAVIEAKDNHHAVGTGMQQALDYAATLDPPSVTPSCSTIARAIPIRSKPKRSFDPFPSQTNFAQRYCLCKAFTPKQVEVVEQDLGTALAQF